MYLNFDFELFLRLNIYAYTLSVKRNLSLLQSALTNIHRIKINHIWTQKSYNSPHEVHVKNQKVTFFNKEKNAVK